MLALLEDRGYLLKDPSTGRYELTVRFYALAHARNPIEALVAAAKAPMESLAAEVGESCHLGALRGPELLILAQAHGPGAVRLSIEPGSSFPALRTASGRLLAALLPDDARRLAFPRAPLRALARARAAGWVAAHDQTIRGVRDLAVRVPVPGGHAALTVSWLSARGGGDKSRRLLPKVTACARVISERLGMKGIAA
jgi:DNA-binding IclR family transcriptional regulator